MRNLSLQRGDAFILVYDVTNAETFEEVRRIRDDIHKVRQTNTVPIVVVGNKIDLADTETREVCLLLLTHFDAHIFFAELGSLSHILSLWLYFYLFVCPLHKFLLFFLFTITFFLPLSHALSISQSRQYFCSFTIVSFLCAFLAIRGFLSNSNQIRFC